MPIYNMRTGEEFIERAKMLGSKLNMAPSAAVRESADAVMAMDENAMWFYRSLCERFGRPAGYILSCLILDSQMRLEAHIERFGKDIQAPFLVHTQAGWAPTEELRTHLLEHYRKEVALIDAAERKAQDDELADLRAQKAKMDRKHGRKPKKKS